VAAAAGLRTLELLDQASYRMLAGRAEQLAAGLAKVIGEAGLAVQLPRVEGLVGIYFAEEPVRDADAARRSVANGRYRRFFHAMLARGIALAPGPYEIMFPGLAHAPDDIERTIDIASAAAAEAALRE
jgi:glutamate-1-semialdehyde 2,1-aminomutase